MPNVGTITAEAASFHAPLPAVHATRLAIVLHGLNSTATIFAGTEPGLSLIAGLRAEGYTVIVPEEPYASNAVAIRADISRDGGVSYRALWRTTFAADVAAAGPVASVTVVGISWGGLHAILAACDDPAVSAIVVHMPVIDAANLTELSGLTLPGLDVTACAGRIAALRGQFSFGTIDTRVGVAPSVAFGKAIASPTMRVIAEHEGHTTSAADVALMLAGAL